MPAAAARPSAIAQTIREAPRCMSPATNTPSASVCQSGRAAMVPRPGESGAEWWVNTRHGEARGPEASDDPVEIFLHDVSPDVARESEHHVYEQSGAVFAAPWPLDAWPDVPTRFLLCRDDRFFPADFQRRVVRERLGIVPDEMDGGHLPALTRPHELAERILRYYAELERASQ